MAENKKDKNQAPKRKDTNSLLSEILEETRMDAELELLQLEEKRKKQREEEERRRREAERRSKEEFQRQLEEEKRKRAEALKRFEERKKKKEAPTVSPQVAQQTVEQQKTGRTWILISGISTVVVVAIALIVVLTRPSGPIITFNPTMPDGVGKAVGYNNTNFPIGPDSIQPKTLLTPEQVVLNITPSLYVVHPPKPKTGRRVRRVRRHKKRRVRIKVKLFSPGSIVK